MAKKFVKRVRRRYRSYAPRRSSKMTIPLAPVLGLVAGYARPAVVQKFISGDFAGGLKDMKEVVTCFDDNGFRPDLLQSTYGPIAAGLIIHMTVGKIVNRVLGRAKVPYLRI